MGCTKCPAGYWECDGEGTECSGGAGGPWTTKGTVKLQIPGGGKLIVDVKARCSYNEKDDTYYPRVRLKVKGIESPGQGGIWIGEPVKLDDAAAAAEMLEEWSSAHVANRAQEELAKRLQDYLTAAEDDGND